MHTEKTIANDQFAPFAQSRANGTSTADLPFGAHLSLVSTRQGLASLETGWRALELTSLRPISVFQSFDWVSNWSQIYLAPDADTEVCILAGYDEEKLVFVWPLMKTKSKGMIVLRWLSEPFSQYGDVICAEDQNAATWIKVSLGFLKRLKNIDLLRLRHVRADSNVGQSATKYFTDANLTERAPYLDLKLFPTNEAYEERYSSTQRKRRKKIRKEIEKFGEVTFTKVPAGSIADQEIAEAICQKNEWLSKRGRQNRVLCCPAHLAFLKGLSRAKNSAVEVITTVLKAGDKSVSWEVGFRYRNTHFAYLTSHVNELTDLSPGRLHMDQSQRQCIADGMTQFDLMVPYDPHKESWSSGMVETKDYYVPLSKRGAFYGKVYLENLRPIIRSIYYKLPPSALRLLKPLIGH